MEKNIGICPIFFVLKSSQKIISRSTSQLPEIDKPEKHASLKLIDEEEAATGSVGLGVYVRYFKRLGLWLSLIGFASNLLYQAASVYSNGNKIEIS